MPPPRLVFFLTVAIGLPTLLTFISLLRTHPRSKYASEDEPRTGLGALFSFHTPSSLFPPSAIISLTDDNSTFFLSRPADFGPSLQSDGLSGPLWIGSGFGEDDLGRSGAGAGAEGELGCSDVPGWDEKFATVTTSRQDENQAEAPKSGTGVHAGNSGAQKTDGGEVLPSGEDGTDDHLHHPLPSSPVSKPVKRGEPAHRNEDSKGHADIQSLQEGAEIHGKVALLSRGGCGFLEKVKWAQRRGATALIVGDHTRGGALVTMYARGDTSNISIPSVFTSHTTAHLLSSLIPPLDDDGDTATDDVSALSASKDPSSDAADIGDESKPTFTSDSRPKSTLVRKAPKMRKISTTKAHQVKEVPKPGFFASFKTFFGFRQNLKDAGLHSDSRRPPSSGRIDWHGDKHKNEKAKGAKASSTTSSSAKSSSVKQEKKKSSHQKPNDDFVIGVQDWRDPDLVKPKASSTKSISTSTTPTPLSTQALLHKTGKDAISEQVNAALSGGSITPGSGEYGKPGDSPGKSAKNDEDSSGSASGGANSNSNKQSQSEPTEEHEGLWVTITPTTMSTSPFFDTLLVLVVSPLVTLTVVYALLLLRSRIRRRRWRAPKSVVDRLPIRTYQTMSTSSTASSTRYATPETSSPTSPLLQSSPRAVTSRTRPRSATTTAVGDAVSASLEKATAKASITQHEKLHTPTKKRKQYRSKQAECVVCLEEYVEGHSRVMSLPCGHEFHAECITPWLTTRRRTCPICKGDVVRSMAQPSSSSSRSPASRGHQSSNNEGEIQTQAAETVNESPTAAIPIPCDTDLEQGEDLAATLVNDEEPESSSRSGWAALTSVSLGAFSGEAAGRKNHDHRDR
ncbi:uncharacterized protein KY384_001214 [Bacidia gigantensis]|uniref:uncharacterized protein n=1 Tax=Bacidia gigantensis TaxID=2732470 RepID=UPI001D053712|nr:uncharacterized protein KY384_001214 [Bacidia gigantensis]KAG8534369.1 hypothetical protein KY384_001214 [Bacidia gigantensis]